MRVRRGCPLTQSPQLPIWKLKHFNVVKERNVQSEDNDVYCVFYSVYLYICILSCSHQGLDRTMTNMFSSDHAARSQDTSNICCDWTCTSLYVCYFTCLSVSALSVSVEDSLSPAFVRCERPQTVRNGRSERPRFNAEVQQLQTRTVQLTVDWTNGRVRRLLRQLPRNNQ